MENLKKEVSGLINKIGKSTILIHSDLVFGFPIKVLSKDHFLESHYNELKNLTNGLDIWMPAFNYLFCKGIQFDVMTDVSHVGMLTEYYRNSIAEWRSEVPVFSFSGCGIKPKISENNCLDPFDKDSLFAYLDKGKGLLMHYGSKLRTTTLIHYVERISGNLPYRYDKIFAGTVIVNNNERRSLYLKYHVRPLGHHFDYDWNKIGNDLLINEVLFTFKQEKTCIIILRIDSFVNFILNKLIEDPLYLIDDKTKEWVIPKLNELGRNFTKTDFENEETT